MGMKVAAISTLCQDFRVFDAMMMAGTPCPYEGLIGDDAKNLGLEHTDQIPEKSKYYKVKKKSKNNNQNYRQETRIERKRDVNETVTF